MSTTDTVIAAFSEMAAKYEQTVDRELKEFWGVGYREFIGRFVERAVLVEAEDVLDIGTGTAVVPATLLRQPKWRGQVVGVDITPAMLRGARQTLATDALHRVRLVCGSGMVLPFSDNTFDTVTCALATHHMQVPALLAEVHRVLRPGGQLLLADVGPAAFWASVLGKAMLNTLAWLYIRREGTTRATAEMEAIPNMRTPEQWRAHLGDAGFALEYSVTVPARHRWYPPGILIDARADVSPEGWKKNG